MDKSLVTETADDLIYIAESDVMAFNELLAETYYPADRKYNIICFHAAQAVEKFLKGFIINNNKTVKKIHDLDTLLKSAMEIDNSFSKILDNCLLLNEYGPKIKYNTRNQITKQNMDDIIKSLETICNFPPIKTMRDSFGKKHSYEIAAEIITRKHP